MILNQITSTSDINTYNNIKNNNIKNNSIKFTHISQCSVGIDFLNQDNLGINKMYYIEYFSNDQTIIDDFLKSIKLLNFSKESSVTSKNRIISVNVTGSGHLSLYCRRTNQQDKHNPEIKTYKLFPLTTTLINTIFNNPTITTHNKSHFTYYYNNFPDQLKFINDQDFFMIPNFGNCYADNKTINTIIYIANKYKTNTQLYDTINIDPNLTKLEINNMYSMAYTIYVKDNGNTNDLSKSKYRHIFFLDGSSTDKFTRIKKQVHNFFIWCGIMEDDIDMRISLHELKYKTMWITINIKLRNTRQYYYNINNEIYEKNTIQINELLYLLDKCKTNNTTLGELIDGKYNIIISDLMIDEYNITQKGVIINKATYSDNKMINKRFNPIKGNIDNIQDNFKYLNTIIFKNTTINKKELMCNYNHPYFECNQNSNMYKININKITNQTNNQSTLTKITGNIYATRLGKSSLQHNELFINGKLNKELQVVRILSYKGNSNSSCSMSICCKINLTYYIINIIPRTSAYLSQINQNNNQTNNNNVIKYLCKSGFINSTNSDDFIVSFKHDTLYYLMEIINISPMKDIDCTTLDNIPKSISRSMSLMRQDIFINLEESYDLSKHLINCYKEYFGIPLYLIIYNIIRNLYFFKNNPIHDDTKDYLIKGLILIEYYFTININPNQNITELVNKLQTKYYFIDTILLYNQNNIIFCDTINDPFICFPGRQSGNQDPTQYKKIIWYTPHSFNSIADINIAINNLVHVYKNKQYREFEDKHKFEYSIVTENNINMIYNTNTNTHPNFDINIFKDNYLFNISNIFDNQHKFNTIKTALVNFMNKIKLFSNNETIYGLYHYPTTSLTNTLHIQLYKKASYGMNSYSSMNYIGQNQSNLHEITKYYFLDFTELSYDQWINNHPYIIHIHCSKLMLDILNRYYTEYNGKTQLFKNIILDILLKKKPDNIDIQIVVKFLIDVTNKSRHENPIYKYNYDVYMNCNNTLYTNLLKHNNNLKIFLRNIYYIYGY